MSSTQEIDVFGETFDHARAAAGLANSFRDHSQVANEFGVARSRIAGSGVRRIEDG